MTTSHHTPIPQIPLQEAAATLFNSRFSSLDTGIDDALSFGVNNNAELAAARGGYVSLDARLDALIAIGGNIATQANGSAAAGQKNVTVDSTTGFVATAYVAYTLAGGTVEYNTIASITPSTLLTLGTDIGTGGIADNTYISMISPAEYQAANAIHHGSAGLNLVQAMEYAAGGVFNVKAYGAMGDGTTDDTAALEAVWANLSEGDTLILPAGIYVIADTVDWTNKTAITILANNATIKAKSGVNFANKAMLNMAGSQYCNVVGLRIDCALSSNKPRAGLVLARTGGLVNGGANKFDNCWFSGNYTFAVVYAVGSELTSFWHCRFLTNVGGIPNFYTSSTDDASLAENTASNVCYRFYACTFLDYSGAATGQVLIRAQGVSKELVFRDCYMVLTGGGNVIELSGTGASMYGLVLDSLRVEGVDHASSRLLKINQDNATHHCEIKQITWTIASDFVIEVTGSSSLRYSNLSLLYPLAGTTKWLQVSNAIYYNHIVVGKAGTISIDAGDSASVNFIVSFGDGSPFAGAGTHDGDANQNNITVSLDDSGSAIGVARTRSRYMTVDSDATPSVKKRDFLFMNYGSPTTITDFSDAVYGQTITLVTANGNITIDDNGTIVLKGRANWTMPASATLTLRELGGQWYEVGRMDPT